MSFRLKLICLLALPAWLAFVALAAPRAEAQSATIAAVVNGDVITNDDVDARARFFALATGQQLSPDVLQRLRPQILQQLINERLEIQEVERRGIVIPDKQVAAAIGSIERNNNMAPGQLRGKLEALGVDPDTLIAQVRTQLGWTQVLRQVVGELGRPSDADINRQLSLMKQAGAQPQYNVGEIFIPVNSPAAEAGAEKFAETVITELRAGGSFPIIAAQFSQGATALQGGALGWVGGDQLDPAVAQLVNQMPVGAISNPVPVAGGLVIVQLRGRQQAGAVQASDPADVVLTVRQVFLPFTSPLDQQNPTEQQRQTMVRLHSIQTSAHSCSDMEAANRAAGGIKPSDPGPVNLAQVTPPQFQTLLERLPVNQPSPPLLAQNGVTLVMICSRGTQAAGLPSREQVAEQLFNNRVGLAAQQTLDQLHRQSSIKIMED
ncbi:peptidylprolyl isomerase [Acidisoma sp.]|uniref:peptidylprolyl isomerase n=1 Tax=Acidisoma sp. TaxID=1872115 RepID=UPI003B009FCC